MSTNRSPSALCLFFLAALILPLSAANAQYSCLGSAGDPANAITLLDELGSTISTGSTVTVQYPTGISPAARPSIRRLEVRNDGADTLYLGVYLDSTGGGALSLMDPCAVVPPGGKHTFDVVFGPSSSGNYDTTLRLDVGGGTDVTYSLDANGITLGSLPACEPGPAKLRVELNRALRTTTPAWDCNWIGRTDYDFSNWGSNMQGNGRSENIPVLAAAVGLFGQPVVNTNQDLRLWFRDFLAMQLGKNPVTVSGVSGSGTVRYFKASEMFSNVYDTTTVGAVAAAHYWAHEWTYLYGSETPVSSVRRDEIKTFAREYLRANWYAYGLASGSQKASGIQVLKVDGAGNPQDTFPNPPNQANNFVSIASPRSWSSGHLSVVPFFAMAQGDNAIAPGHNSMGLDERRFFEFLSDNWPGTEPNVYGLDGGDRTALDALRISETIPSNLNTIFSNVNTVVNVHFLLWDDARATVMEDHTPNTAHDKAIFGVSFDNSNGKVVHLSPWDNNTTGLGSAEAIGTHPTTFWAQGDGVARTMSFSTFGTLRRHIVLTPSGYRQDL